MKNLARAYIPAPKETPVTIGELLTTYAALGDLLAEEAVQMEAMRINKVAELQDRKLKLTGLLERYMQYLRSRPEVMQTATAQEKIALSAAHARFNKTAKANYDTLLVARAVNRSVVQCVTQVVTRRERNPVYNARGVIGMAKTTYKPLSVTLNQTV